MAATDPELPLVLEDDVAVRLRIEEQAEVNKLLLSYSTTNYNVVDPRSSEIALLTMSSRRPASLAHQEAGNIRCAGYWDAHEIILEEARQLAREAAERGDAGSNDLIVSRLIRSNELQSWFVGEHLSARSAP